MAGVEQNTNKTNNGCIKHLPQTGPLVAGYIIGHEMALFYSTDIYLIKYVRLISEYKF